MATKAETKKSKTAGRALKVFQATLGFYETVVAVPSQAAASRAWGTTQNLFKDGTARPSSDGKAIDAAKEKPGVVLRRAIGAKGAFGIAPGIPDIPDLPSKKTGSTKPARKEVDRRALDRAEAELDRVEEKWRGERDAFEKRRYQLEADEADAERRFQAARDQARNRVERERRSFTEAGGKPKG